MNSQDMFETIYGFDGVEVEVDPIDRKHSDNDDNVMAMFADEQPVTWHIAKPYIKKALNESGGEIDFIDVGTGSGIFGVLFAKHFGGKIIAIDKSPRAIEFANKNAAKNNVKFETKEEWYDINSVQLNSAKVIGLYPPYHLYPKEIEGKIPQHARGGWNGQEVFIDQLEVAKQHLAKNGIIFVNQMCLGDENGPKFNKYIPKMMPGASIYWTNVPGDRISTKTFLDGVYGGKHRDFVKKLAAEHPWLYYAVILIKQDGKGNIVEFKHDYRLPSTEEVWKHRIELHRQLALHEYH